MYMLTPHANKHFIVGSPPPPKKSILGQDGASSKEIESTVQLQARPRP